MHFRPFDYSDGDYQTYVQLNNAVYPDRPRTVEYMRYFESTRGPEEVSQTFFLEQQSLGWFTFMTPRSNAAPGQLEVEWGLLPGYQGLQERLWAELESRVAHQPARELITRVREDWPQADFYQAKGFVVYDRMWASTLDLEAFDPAPFQRPLPQGIKVATLAGLDYQREAVQRQYYQLMVALLRDVPFTQPLEIWPFELWQERVMKDSKLIPEAHFIALEGGQMVGVSQLSKSSRPHTLQTGLTGVLKPYRRQGIAQALKLRAAQYAKQQGYRYIRTSNHQANRPMLAINEALGFAKEPAWISLKKEP